MVTVVNFKDKVTLYYSYKGKVLRLSLGINWKERNIKENIQIISKKKQNIEQIITNHIISSGDKPTVDFIKNNINIKTTNGNLSIVVNFSNFLNFKNNSALKPQSIKDFNNLFTALKEYDIHKKRQHLISDISPEFIDNFQFYLSFKRHLNSNTIRKRIVTLRQFLRWVASNNIYPYPIFLSQHRIVPSYSTDIISLSIDELTTIYNLQLNGTEEKIRDIFMLLCLTGMRSSDLLTLKKHHIQNNYIIKNSIKTNILFKVPITPTVQHLLEKYNYSIPFYSNQHLNRIIKRILSTIPSFNEHIIIERQTFKKIEPIYIEKYKMIGTHTGRRTFITNSINNGLTINKIMDMVGHTKINTLLKYIHKLQDINIEDKEKINFI